MWSIHQSLIHNGKGERGKREEGNRIEGSREQRETDSRKSQSFLLGDSLGSEEHLLMKGCAQDLAGTRREDGD